MDISSTFDQAVHETEQIIMDMSAKDWAIFGLIVFFLLWLLKSNKKQEKCPVCQENNHFDCYRSENRWDKIIVAKCCPNCGLALNGKQPDQKSCSYCNTSENIMYMNVNKGSSYTRAAFRPVCGKKR